MSLVSGAMAVMWFPPRRCPLVRSPRAGVGETTRPLRGPAAEGFGAVLLELPGCSPGCPVTSVFGARPHRLAAKDTTLSRWRHGFEPRWGCSGLATTLVLVAGHGSEDGDHRRQRLSCSRDPNVTQRLVLPSPAHVVA